VQEANVTLEAIRALAGPDVVDPFTDPATGQILSEEDGIGRLKSDKKGAFQ
jgi:hypothetical protein